MTTDSPLRLASDIGGTFTDTVLMRGQQVLATNKTLTTHSAPALGALAGAEQVLQASDRPFHALDGLVHGTTLATNALIERRGAVVATVTTTGFRDILEIAYERRYSQYDINLQKPDFLVPRHRRFTVPERLSVRGDVLMPLTPDGVDTLLRELDESDCTAVAVCLLHSYANPAHEQQLADAIARERPELAVSLSSAVSPEAREFDRLCTTVANAYIQPLMADYLGDFAARFTAAGVRCPVLMMTAGGGMCTLDTARQFPVRLVESGPAGGAILASRIAHQAGVSQALSFDMGGTTAKLCLIDDTPQKARQFEIARQARFIKGSGMPVRIPVIDMIEIGAGGGSIASTDRLGRLQLGPESAGSEPGPAAFGRGGDRPTVTDADLTLGYLDADTFAEGRLSLDSGASRSVLLRDIAPALGLAGDAAAVQSAYGVSQVVDENMASAARMHAVESGKDLGQRTLIAFGGNGPLHATRVARAAGVNRLIVPPDPSVGSALGFLYAPVSFEIVRSHYSLLDTLDFTTLNALLDNMTREATTVVAAGAPDRTPTLTRTAFLRYHGQGHEIDVLLPPRALTADDTATLQARFETAYATQYSRPVPGMQIEILNWAVTASVDLTPPAARAVDTGQQSPSPTAPPAGVVKQIHCDRRGCEVDAPVYQRRDLLPGHRIDGPALIAEAQTTTVVSTGFRCDVDPALNLILTHREYDNG